MLGEAGGVKLIELPGGRSWFASAIYRERRGFLFIPHSGWSKNAGHGDFELFAEYLAGGFSASEAARRAGYQASSARGLVKRLRAKMGEQAR